MKSWFVIGVCYWNIDHWEIWHFGKMCSIRGNKKTPPSDRKELCNKSKYVEIYFWNYDHIMHWTCFWLNLLSQSEFLFDQNGSIFCVCMCMCVCTLNVCTWRDQKLWRIPFCIYFWPKTDYPRVSDAIKVIQSFDKPIGWNRAQSYKMNWHTICICGWKDRSEVNFVQKIK